MLTSVHQLRELAGISVIREVKRSHAVIKKAHKAKDAANKPDHAIRLKAADLNLKLVDAYPKDSVVADPSRPIAVQIILAGTNGHDAPAVLQTHGVAIHLDSDNGDSA